MRGFPAEEADIWSRAGWAPEQAHQICDMYDDARGAAIAWAFTGLAATEANDPAVDLQSPALPPDT